MVEKVGSLVLAVVFSASALVPSDAALHTIPPSDVPESVRPTVAVTKTLRELESLGMSMTLATRMPEANARRAAQSMWFPGETVGDEDPVETAAARTGLPLACIWFVTAEDDEAIRAAALGMNVVHVANDRLPATEAPDARGVYVVPAIDGFLDIIRVPYTRSALSMRFMLRRLIAPRPETGAPQ